MESIGLVKMLKSKRAWSAFGTFLAVILADGLGIEIQPELIVMIGGVLVGGFALEDAARAVGGNKEAATKEVATTDAE